jgi:hypothetical protein
MTPDWGPAPDPGVDVADVCTPGVCVDMRYPLPALMLTGYKAASPGESNIEYVCIPGM